jgi:hypothetical protein
MSLIVRFNPFLETRHFEDMSTTIDNDPRVIRANGLLTDRGFESIERG